MNRTIVVMGIIAGAIAVLLVLDDSTAYAASGSGGGLPYEMGLTKVLNSTKGPLAQTLSVVGIVVACGILVFGGDMSGFFRTLILLVLVIGVLVKANGFASTMFGSGAVISAVERSVRASAMGELEGPEAEVPPERSVV